MRKMTRVFASTVLLALASAACAGPSEPADVPVGQQFELAAGESARAGTNPVTVRFVSVPQDSRCPVDVQCVTAGDATVRLELSGGGGATTTAELHTNAEPRSAPQGSYEVELLDLRPAPRSTRPTAPGDYVAVLRISGP
jgi:hypothetical protein